MSDETTDQELRNAQERLDKLRAQQRREVREGKLISASEALEETLERLSTLKGPPVGHTPAPQNDDERRHRAWDAAEVPARHRKVIVWKRTREEGSYNELCWTEKIDFIAGKFRTGFMLALVGAQGVGKSQMGATLVLENHGHGRSSRVTSALDFFIALKSTYNEGKISEAAAIQSFVKPDFLVLDEMDERSESDWENRMLFHMLNKRYAAMKDTLLISRRSTTDFLASVGESIQSRLQETGGVIECGWKSFREAQ